MFDRARHIPACLIASAGLLVVFVSVEEIVRRLVAARRRAHVLRDVRLARAALEKAVRYGHVGQSGDDRCGRPEVWVTVVRCHDPRTDAPCMMAVCPSDTKVLPVTGRECSLRT